MNQKVYFNPMFKDGKTPVIHDGEEWGKQWAFPTLALAYYHNVWEKGRERIVFIQY